MLEFSVGGPEAEDISAKGAGKAVNGRLGEGRRVGTVQELDTHHFVGETSGAIALVIWHVWHVSVVIGKVPELRCNVRWDVTCGLGSETKEGKLIKVGRGRVD